MKKVEVLRYLQQLEEEESGNEYGSEFDFPADSASGDEDYVRQDSDSTDSGLDNDSEEANPQATGSDESVNVSSIPNKFCARDGTVWTKTITGAASVGHIQKQCTS